MYDWAKVETRATDGIGYVLSDHTIKSYKFIWLANVHITEDKGEKYKILATVDMQTNDTVNKTVLTWTLYTCTNDTHRCMSYTPSVCCIYKMKFHSIFKWNRLQSVYNHSTQSCRLFVFCFLFYFTLLSSSFYFEWAC